MKNDTVLNGWRKEVDALDGALLSLLVKRMKIVRKIGVYKKQNGLSALDPKRRDSIRTKLMTKAKILGIHPDFVNKLWSIIHSHALVIESERSTNNL